MTWLNLHGVLVVTGIPPTSHQPPATKSQTKYLFLIYIFLPHLQLAFMSVLSDLHLREEVGGEE